MLAIMQYSATSVEWVYRTVAGLGLLFLLVLLEHNPVLTMFYVRDGLY